MKKLILFLPVLFMLLVQSQTAKAGDTTSVTVTDSVGKPVYQVIDSIFRPLDRSAMSTEFLGTKAFSLVNHELYHGSLADSNYVTYGNMWALYGFWATACTDNNYTFAYDSLQGYKQTLKAHRDSGYVPLTLTIGRYDELKDSAIADSLIRYKNGQLEDIANRPASPYKTQYLAAGAPAMRSIAAYPVTYRIPEALITGPLRDSISQLYINFGDSAGYQSVQTGTNYDISYPDTGQKTLTYKVVLTNNDTLYTHTHLQVNAVSNAIYEPVSDEHFFIDEDDSENGHFGARVDIEYGDCNNDEELKRPLIVVEGFDPRFLDPGTPRGDLHYINFRERLNDENFSVDLENANYDLVYVDFERGGDRIQRNARVLRDVIQEVNDRKVTDQPNVVLGYSMGGLVARWALKGMEWDDEAHETAKFISFDAPHRGANVPLGMQYMFQHLRSIEIDVPLGDNIIIMEQSPQLQRMENVFTTPAAKQMLKFYANSYNRNPEKSVYVLDQGENQFLDQLEQRGWPHDCRNVAIANGSQTGAQMNGFNDGGTIMKMISDDKFIAPIFRMAPWATVGGVALTAASIPELMIALGSNYHVNFQVNAQPDAGASSGFLYSGKIHWNIGPAYKWITSLTVSMQDPEGVDNAPGGFYEIPGNIENTVDNTIPDEINYDFEFNGENFSFIPTISALDIDMDETNGEGYDFNVQNNDITEQPKLTAVSDFDAPDGSINGTPDNEEHRTFSQYNTDFLNEELTQDDIQTPLTTTYNLGKSIQEETSTNHIIHNLTIENGGELHINGDEPLGYAGDGRPKPVEWRSFQAVTLGYCSNGANNIEVTNNGKVVVGDHINGREGNLTISEGSSLILGGNTESNKGTLKINDNSRLVVEEGGDLIIRPGADIILNGDNAELEIRGELIIQDDATFTFSNGPAGNGKVVFDSEEEDYIQFGQNTGFKLNGTGMPSTGDRDEILEIRQDQFTLPVTTHSNDKLMTVELDWGNVLLAEESEFILAQNFFTPNFVNKRIQIHNLKFEGIDGQRHGGVTIIGGPNDIDFSSLEITNANAGLEILGNHNPDFKFNNLRIKDCDIGVHSSMAASVKLHECSLKNNGIGWKAEGMRAASEFTGSIENSTEEGILFRGDNTSSLYVNAEIFSNKHGIRFYGNTLRTYCSEIVDNDQNGVQAEWANLYASSSMTPYGGYTDFSGNQTAIKIKNNLTYDLFLNEGFNNFQSADWTLSGFSTFNYFISAAQNHWGNPNQPVYNTNHDLTSFIVGVPYPRKYPIFFDYSPTITEQEFDNTSNNECSDISDPIGDPGVVEMVLPDGESAPVINTESYSSLTLDSALESAMAVTADTTVNDRFVKGIEQFHEILTYNYESPKDSITTYLLNKAYHQMTFNLGRALADSQVVINDNGNLPSIADTVVNTQEHLLNLLDSNDRHKAFLYQLDRAMVYRDFGQRDEALSQLNTMESWVEDTTNLEVIDYWQCVTNYEKAMVDTTITNLDSLDNVYNCTLPEFYPPEIEEEDTVDQVEKRASPISEENAHTGKDELKLYPNPAKEQLFLATHFDETQNLSIAVYNLQGQRIMSPYNNVRVKSGKDQLKINTQPISNGQYFVRINHGSESTMLRFTKVNR